MRESVVVDSSRVPRAARSRGTPGGQRGRCL